jgi:hypothetical protein
VTKFILVHIPKTAGMSLRRGFIDLFGEASVGPHFAAGHLGPSHAEAWKNDRLIAGHLSASDLALFPGRKVLTVLREPIDRCLSWYYYARAARAPELMLDMAAAQKNGVGAFFDLHPALLRRNLSNRMVRQLGGHALDFDEPLDRCLKRAQANLKEYAWVGFQETMRIDVRRLSALDPDLADFALPRVNVTAERRQPADVRPETLSRIAALNEYDIELYRWAKREFGGNG